MEARQNAMTLSVERYLLLSGMEMYSIAQEVVVRLSLYL
jgi:hypothetical protein